MAGGNKCRGCKTKVKQHKFGQWGPACQGPPNDGEGEEDKMDMMGHLRAISARLKNLESESSGAQRSKPTVQTLSSSEEDEPDFNSMTREQMIQFVKNSNKERDQLAKAAQSNQPGRREKNVRFFISYMDYNV